MTGFATPGGAPGDLELRLAMLGRLDAEIGEALSGLVRGPEYWRSPAQRAFSARLDELLGEIRALGGEVDRAQRAARTALGAL